MPVWLVVRVNMLLRVLLVLARRRLLRRRDITLQSKRIVDIDLGPHSHSKLNHTIRQQCHIIHRNICIRALLRLLSHRSSNHCSSNRFSNSSNRVVFVE